MAERLLDKYGLRFLSHVPRRCLYSQYQDTLYALRHFTDGVAYTRLNGICSLRPSQMYSFLARAEEVGHVECEKGKNFIITDEGVEYNISWFAIQDRFNIGDIVSSAFIIHDVNPDKEAIKTLMANISDEYPDRRPCYRSSKRDDFCARYLDGFRYLKKHREGITKYDTRVKLGYSPLVFRRFMETALSKGHIEFDEKRKTPRGSYVKATEEGMALLDAVNWLVTKCYFGDFVPSLVG